ncbi:MAG: hypothetical protein M1515_02790 [Candidatus Thermoplasmatota archaeon]|jgi:hypothetical protein|nr:hypothetical protein [Candidatus Thermoplasmatota archaeon]
MDPFIDDAKGLVFAAIVVQLVFTVIGLIGLAIVGIFLSIPFYSAPSPSTTNVPILFSGILIAGAIAVVGFGLVWLFLDYFLIYRVLEKGRAKDASTVTLVLGIIQLMTDLIPGILLILAYTKIQDSIKMELYSRAK